MQARLPNWIWRRTPPNCPLIRNTSACPSMWVPHVARSLPYRESRFSCVLGRIISRSGNGSSTRIKPMPAVDGSWSFSGMSFLARNQYSKFTSRNYPFAIGQVSNHLLQLPRSRTLLLPSLWEMLGLIDFMPFSATLILRLFFYPFLPYSTATTRTMYLLHVFVLGYLTFWIGVRRRIHFTLHQSTWGIPVGID